MRYKINIILILLILFLMPFTIKAENVYRGSGDKQSITDIMGNYAEGDYTTPDEKVMKKAIPKIQNTTGTIISVIIYIIFAFNVLTTTIDLAWIAIPPLRPYLYNPNEGSANAYISRDTGWATLANRAANRANEYQAQANQHQVNAANLARNGDIHGADLEMNRARFANSMANDNRNSANRRMQYQRESDARHARWNQEHMNDAVNRAKRNRDNRN